MSIPLYKELVNEGFLICKPNPMSGDRHGKQLNFTQVGYVEHPTGYLKQLDYTIKYSGKKLVYV